MWDSISDLGELGNKLIESLYKQQWFRGWQGIPLGCNAKPITMAAMRACMPISEENRVGVRVYLDGSDPHHEGEPIMTWGFCCFFVDSEDNHELFFCSGGIVCTDTGSELYFGAETCNSYTAEVQANVFARLWLLQSSLKDEMNVVFLHDNQAAADAVGGIVVSRTNSMMCKIGVAIDRVCSNIFCTSSHHIHSHDEHPWNELADVICTFIARKPQEAKAKWIPISPVCAKTCFCIDLASLLAGEFVQQSLVKDEDIELSKQIALNSKYMASKIDTHGSNHPKNAVAVPVLTIQYNVQTLKMEDDEIDLFSRFRSEKCAIVCIQGNRKDTMTLKICTGI